MSTTSIFPSKNLSQGITPANAMEDAEGISNVALAAGFGTCHDCKRANSQCFFGEILGIAEPKRSDHCFWFG